MTKANPDFRFVLYARRCYTMKQRVSATKEMADREYGRDRRSIIHMKQVIVIGCGPSGMMAAIAAARSGAKTTILEAGPKPGRKLLLTGNGKCNMTNLTPDILSAYMSSNPEEAKQLTRSVLDQFSVEDTVSFFKKEGLLTTVEHGTYVYPVTEQAGSVLDILLRAMKNLNIKMKYSEEVIAIERNSPDPDSTSSDDAEHTASPAWNVRTATWTYHADSVIISCGSRAVPSTGSNGAGYELCRMLGLDVTDILPGNTAVVCSLPLPDTKAYVPGSQKKKETPENPLSAAAGTRISGIVSIYADGRKVASEKGQLQFTQQDVSGIVVYNLSRYVIRGIHAGADVVLSIDMLPAYSSEYIDTSISDIRSKFEGISDEELLGGFVASRLIPAVMYLHRLTGSSYGYVLKHFDLNASGLRGFDSTQVCVGGVRVTELDLDTLECVSDDLKGIYLTGELIDIDGPCGGYNLQWAWSSGYTAGLHAAKD